MSDTSPILHLPYLQPAQAQKHVTHNEALRLLDAVTQLTVLSATQTTPPSVAAVGDRYIAAAPATSAWAGQDGRITVYTQTGWEFFAAQTGWRADVTETGQSLRFDGTGWVPVVPETQNLPVLGVATTADATNRLAVSADATLLSHAGAGHQLKINKDSAGDTASLLFQTGWSGRAEMGTSGSDDFAIKVSADGTTFRTALSVEAGSGAVQMPSGQTYFEDIFIANDTVWSFDIPWSNPSRILMWLAVNVTGQNALFSITGALSGAANFGPMFVSPAGSLNFLTGSLDGTTGADGAINLSIDASGAAPRMYVENRLGANRLFTLATLGK